MSSYRRRTDDDDGVWQRRFAALEEELYHLRASTKSALEQSWAETESLQRSMAEQDRKIERLRRKVAKSHTREELWRSKFESAQERLLFESRRESTHSIRIEDNEDEDDNEVVAAEDERAMSFHDSSAAELLQSLRMPTTLVLGGSTRNLVGSELLEFDHDDGPGHATDADTEEEEAQTSRTSFNASPRAPPSSPLAGGNRTSSLSCREKSNSGGSSSSSKYNLRTKMRSLSDMLSLLEDECPSQAKSSVSTVPAAASTASASTSMSLMSCSDHHNTRWQMHHQRGEEEKEKKEELYVVRRGRGSGRREINHLLAELSRRDEAIAELERTSSDRAEALSDTQSELDRVRMEGANRERELGEEILRLRRKLSDKKGVLSKYEECEKHIRALTEELGMVTIKKPRARVLRSEAA